MSRLRGPVRAFVVAVVASALLALVAEAGRPRAGADLAVAALLLALTAAAQIAPVHLSAKIKLSVADTPIFAAVLLLDPFYAMVVAGVGSLVGQRLGTRMPLHNLAFNAAAWVLAVAAAGETYAWLGFGAALSLTSLPALVLAAAASFVVKMACTDIVVALQLRRDPISNWWRLHRPELPFYAGLYALGALAGLAALRHPSLLLLFAAPMALLLFALRQATRLRAQTRAALIQLADLIDNRDPYTYGHSQRVAEYAERLARRLRFQTAEVELITEAARLHDIGKIGTPDQILQKPGPLTPAEYAVMQRHAADGYEFLRRMPEFWEGAELVLAHHERADGAGYPRGRRAEDLPQGASVIAVCDAYDAMTSDRVYRPALSWDHVQAELLGGRGTQWDARVVDALLAMVQEDRAADRPGSRTAAGRVTAAV